MKVRDMTSADLDECQELSARIRKDSWGKGENEYYPKDLFEQELAMYTPAVLDSYTGRIDRFAKVATDGRKLVGLVIGKCERDTGVADIGWIGVAPEKQGKGIAGQLLAAALDHSRKAGCHKAIAYTFARLDGANRMYARYGFAKEADMPDHWMRIHFVMYARSLEEQSRG
ncbi:MAG: GNAT family N-acetyltransferase [Thermoplasmata archaeon]|nr:GNAT family N-acetyltransferase [Thermoplasmata archaeon]